MPASLPSEASAAPPRRTPRPPRRRRRRAAGAAGEPGARPHGRQLDGDAAGALAGREGGAQHGAGAGRAASRAPARSWSRAPSTRSARAARCRSSPVNCSAIPEQLLEAEFFGYRKGAFTGANDDREGFFQAANGGTLVSRRDRRPAAVDAVASCCASIQERSVRPVGAVSEQPVDVRLLSATHKDLGAEVQAGQFRQDLYYRLNVIQIRVPPLRERLEDLLGISERVLERHRARRRRLAGAAADARRAGPPAALSVSRQRARAREPAAPRGGAVRRRGARRLRPRPAGVGVHRQRGAGARPPAHRGDASPKPRAPRAAACRPRSRCPSDLAALPRRGRARHPRSARSSAIATTAPRPASASACRCGRCATAWRG